MLGFHLPTKFVYLSMKILVASATLQEVEILLSKITIQQNFNDTIIEANYQGIALTFFISGVGMNAMAYCMGKALNDEYDMAFNIGICGSFSKQYQLGSMVNITHDIFSELGAEDGINFLDMHALKLPAVTEIQNNSPLKNAHIDSLPKVKGITVNTVHGNETSIAKIKTRLNPDVESMEGAAFMYACKREGLPFAQLRTISNYVEPRNKDSWKIPLALENLSTNTLQILDAF